MVEVYVVHLPSQEKLEKFRETVNKLLEMAKNKKLHRIVVKEAESFASLRRG